MSDFDPLASDDDDAPSQAGPTRVVTTAPDEVAGARLDKALAGLMDPALGLSRSRLRALIEDGQVSIDGAVRRDPSEKTRAGVEITITLPPPRAAHPLPETIPLDVVYEDAHLIVVDKPVGMAAHPAPGSETGTLVNALLAHCGESLSGVGGEARPGIVHRIDKQTSGLLVVAKTDAAHQGLAAQFAAHDIERAYLAVAWGAPDRADPRLVGLPAVGFDGPWIRIEAPIARHRADRKRMAVLGHGRHAVTYARVIERFGAGETTAVSALECRLETGRTHQIRVHLSHVGHALIGDPVYGRTRKLADGALSEPARDALAAFPRQALHARLLGFRHPLDDRDLVFESAPPADLAALLDALRGASPAKS